MSSAGCSKEGNLLRPFTVHRGGSRKRRLRSPGSSIFDDDENYANSINPLFLVSGPRGGAINTHTAQAEIDTLADLVDDGVLHVLKNAWEEVAVPADMYWSCPQRPVTGDPTSALLRRDDVVRPTKVQPPRIPRPRSLMTSFYPARVEALAARGYQPNQGLLPVAVDCRGGKGSKVFNVLPRWDAEASGKPATTDASAHPTLRTSAIAKFIHAIPCPTDRNLYVLVDEESPVDPYFDVDFSFNPAVDDRRRLSVLQQVSDTEDATLLDSEVLERTLLTILASLRDEVEKGWSTPVEECLVLTSSLQLGHHYGKAPSGLPVLEELKLSFHVHFRLGNKAAVKSVKELHAFMAAFRTKLQRTQSDCEARNNTEGAKRARLILECVDFGVYTRWRAFRLPYNVKAPEKPAATAVAGGAGVDLLSEQLGQLGATLPDISVGSAAPRIFQSVLFAADAETQKAQRYLVEKLLLYFRFFLPLLPGATDFVNAELSDFLRALTPKEVCAAAAHSVAAAGASPPPLLDTVPSKDVVSAWVMEMSCIVRDASAATSSTATAEGQDSTPALRLLQWCPTAAESKTAPAQANASPFDVPMPPMPRSVRVRVDDKKVKALLAEVFWCIAPEYDHRSSLAKKNMEGKLVPSAAVTPERVNAQYEESIRAYYVFQKQSKYCFRLNRTHKATYAQLYLTFGSIKIRCYSNDCCERCCVIPWEAPKNPQAELQHHPEYPKFNRLVEIRNALFPPLPAGELVRRYGTVVLQQQT